MILRFLNLDRRPDRRAIFEEACPTGCEPVKLPTPDHRHYSWDDSAGSICDLTKNPYYSPCTAAHHYSSMLAWQACSEGDEPYHLFEDDAVLHESFESYATILMEEAPAGWDLILWGSTLKCVTVLQLWDGGPWIHQRCQDLPTPLNRHFFRTHSAVPNICRVAAAWNTFAYTVSPAGAAKLLQLAWPIKMENGLVPGHEGLFAIYGTDAKIAAILGAMNSYIAWPPIAFHPLDKDDSNMEEIVPAASVWTPEERLKWGAT